MGCPLYAHSTLSISDSSLYNDIILMIHILRRFIHSIEQQPFSLSLWSIAFLSLIITRIGIESSLGFFGPRTLTFLFFEFSHTLLFFLIAFLLFIPIMRFSGARSLASASHLLLFGFLIILTPPLIDTAIFQGKPFWSFYEFDGLRGLVIRFFTLFGDTPDIGITYGVRIEVVIVTCGVFCYALLNRQKLHRAFTSGLIAYTTLFILGTFPSYLTLLIDGFSRGFFSIQSTDIAAIFLTPADLFSRPAPDIRSALNMKMSLWYASILVPFLIGYLFFSFRPFFHAIRNNLRPPQIIYHGGLLFLGALLSWHFTKPTLIFDHFHVLAFFLLLVAVECAWIASVISNDYFDIAIDVHTNTSRPLITKTIPLDLYITFGWLFFGASIFLAAQVNFTASLLLVLYQALAWIYSAPPFRLKRIPGLATLIASSAGITILLIGFVVIAPTNSFVEFPFSLLIFLLIAYSVALPLKDFKDIKGDRVDHVYTLPVIFGEERFRTILSSIFFILFIASVFVLHMRIAFFPALLFGGMSFFLIQSARDQHAWCNYRNLPLFMLCIIASYGLVLLWFII